MPIILFQTQALWSMTSSNAMSWNATLNASATFGFNIIPILVIIIIGMMILGLVATMRGF